MASGSLVNSAIRFNKPHTEPVGRACTNGLWQTINDDRHWRRAQLIFVSSRYGNGLVVHMGKPPLIMDMVWVIKKELVNLIFNYGVTPTTSKPAKDKPCFHKQFKTKQPIVNSLNFVVDSLLHALQVVRCLWSLHEEEVVVGYRPLCPLLNIWTLWTYWTYDLVSRFMLPLFNLNLVN